MKKIVVLFSLLLCYCFSSATIHRIGVWEGYYSFLPQNLNIVLGDTIHWYPLDPPTMVHTVTSVNIPAGAVPFDQIWQLPADTFLEYIPAVAGNYEYECTPHAVSWNMVGEFFVDGGQGNENEAETKVFAYPNPVVEQLAVQGWNKSVDYEIFDTTGKMVSQGSSDKIIETGALAAGVYFLRWQGLKTQYLKFLKE